MIVSEAFGMPVEAIESERRFVEVAFVRQVAIYLCYQGKHGWASKGAISHTLISKEFGGRHHTTIHHAIHKIADRRRENESLDAKLTELEAIIAARLAANPQP